MELFDLPTEIVLRTLCFLDISELALLSRTHPKFRALIQDSQGLQYRFAATKASVESNIHSNHAAFERLELLRKQEDGWFLPSFDFKKTVPVVPFPSGIYDLTGGIYFRGDLSRRSIHYCKLPSSPSDSAVWQRVDVDKTLVDIGVSVYEHNLIAVMTITPHSTRTRHNIIEISLLELTTGKPHPLAKNPVLFVKETGMRAPSMLIEIVGDHLVLVMTHPRDAVDDIIRVWDWKKDIVKMNITRQNRTYHNILFLSPTVILLPNHHYNTLDIWEIPSDASSAPTLPSLSLALPVIEDDWVVVSISCRAEPNPMPDGTPYSKAPFHASSKDALAVFSVTIGRPGRIASYVLFVHRSALVAAATTQTSDDLIPRDEDREDWPLGERVREWDNWGPPVSHVLDADNMNFNWITTTAGQRAVVAFSERNVSAGVENNDSVKLRVLDFNSYTVKRVVEEVRKDGGEKLARTIALFRHGLSEIAIGGLVHHVISHLPFVGFDVPFDESRAGHFRGIMMDEERILVMLDDDDGISQKIEIMHIGIPPHDQH